MPKIVGRENYGNSKWDRPGPIMAVFADCILWVLMAFGLGFAIVVAVSLLLYGKL